MPGQHDIASFIHHAKIAQEYMESFSREFKGSKGDALFSTYIKKIEWILTDIKTCPFLPDAVRESIKNQINSDVFTSLAITEKLVLLLPEQREAIEDIIDRVVNGEGLIVNDVKEPNY